MDRDKSDVDWGVVLSGAGFESDDPDLGKAKAAVLKLCGAEALAVYERRFKS